MARKKALERWEKKVRNCEVTSQDLLPIAKSLTKNDESKAPTTVYCPLGITCHPPEKANVIADLLETQFTCHGLCDENQEPRV
jgi:hypothetical protein